MRWFPKNLVHLADPDSIGSGIDDRAKDVEAKALVICENLNALQKSQDTLAGALPAFKPYATIEVHDVSDCRAHSHPHSDSH